MKTAKELYDFAKGTVNEILSLDAIVGEDLQWYLGQIDMLSALELISPDTYNEVNSHIYKIVED